MEFYLNWQYLRGDEHILSQPIRVTVNEAANGRNKVDITVPERGMGEYIANLYCACAVDKLEEALIGYRASEAFAIWSEIAGDPYMRVNNRPENVKYIFSDCVIFLAFCIEKRVKTMLKEVFRGGRRPYSPDTSAHFPELADREHGLTPPEIQKAIDNYVQDYNELLFALLDGVQNAPQPFDGAFYAKLCEQLKKYPDKKMFRAFIGDGNQGNRCIATFLDLNSNQNYVALSGFLDTNCKIILKWMGKEEQTGFIDAVQKICSTLHAVHVPPNLGIPQYRIDNASEIVPGLSLGDVIAWNLPNSERGHYSCCERKILGSLGAGVKTGRLFVKFKMCGECSLAVLWERKYQRSHIDVHDGLGV